MEAERERALEAMTDIVLEGGYEAATVEAICVRAGLTAEAFHRNFTDPAACFIAIYLRNNEDFGLPIFAAFNEYDSWREALRVAAYRAARFLREHPRETAFNTLVTLGAGEMPQAWRDEFLQRIIDMIDRGRCEAADPDVLDRGAAEGVMGSIYQTLVNRLQRGEGTESAEDFVPELMYVAVRPYLGQATALEELTMPPPKDSYGYCGDRG